MRRALNTKCYNFERANGDCIVQSNCPAGHYCSQEYKPSIKPCPKGKYGNRFGQINEIQACNEICLVTNGSYTVEGKRFQKTACPICPAGSYCYNLQRYKCPMGKYGNSEGQQNESSACPNVCPTSGKYSPNDGQTLKETACIICTAGAYCTDFIRTHCPIGTYSNAIGSTNASTCKLCLAGNIALNEGSTSCTLCPNGAYCPNATSKILCPIGTYSNAIGSTNASTCKLCLAGNIALNEGSTSCTLCPNGAYCPNATSKILCPIGTYSNAIGSTNASTCKLCLAGNIALNEGSTSCTLCPNGAYCPNATSKILCPIGKYGGVIEAITEANGCTGTCSVGKYGFPGASQCASCSFGEYGENGTCFKCRHDCVRKQSETFGPQQI
eukprot:g9408.t1